MKKSPIYTTLFAGLTVLSINSYAALDCDKYAYSKSAYDACISLNTTTSTAKKRDQSRFDKLKEAKKQVVDTVAPKPTQPKAQQTETPIAKQAQPSAPTTAPIPPKTQPVPPAYQSTQPTQPSETPEPSTPSTNTKQDKSRMKYY